MKKFLLVILLLPIFVTAASCQVVNNSGSTAADSISIPFLVQDSLSNLKQMLSTDSLGFIVFNPSGAVAYSLATTGASTQITSQLIAGVGYHYCLRVAVENIDGTTPANGVYSYTISTVDRTLDLVTSRSGFFHLYTGQDYNTALDYVDASISTRGTSDFDYTSEEVTVATVNDKTGYSISGTKTTLDAMNDIAPHEVWDVSRGEDTSFTAGTMGSQSTSWDNTAAGTAPPTEAEIYTYFTSTNRENLFKADVTGLSTFDPTTEYVTLSTNSMNSLIDLVWDEAGSGHSTAGTFGYYLDAQISGIAAGSSNWSDAQRDSVIALITTSAIYMGGCEDCYQVPYPLNSTPRDSVRIYDSGGTWLGTIKYTKSGNKLNRTDFNTQD